MYLDRHFDPLKAKNPGVSLEIRNTPEEEKDLNQDLNGDRLPRTQREIDTRRIAPVISFLR